MSTNWNIFSGLDLAQTAMPFRGVAGTTATTLALNSAYTFNSSGAAMAVPFVSTRTANLTDIWFYIVSYTGTWASTDGNINWAIHEGLQANRRPGTTVVASGTFALDGSTTGWHRITGLTASLTIGKLYILVLADADGGATNYVTLQVRTAGSGTLMMAECGTTTNGFSSAYSSIGTSPSCGIQIGDDVIAGQIWNASPTVTTGTYERGLRLRLPEPMVIAGPTITTDAAIFFDGHTYKLYADATDSGGSTLITFSPSSTASGGATAPSPNHMFMDPSQWTLLEADTWYRWVVAPASNLTVPRKSTLLGSPDADLKAAAIPFGGDFHWTHWDTATSQWIDEPDNIPQFGPILIPPAAAASGGGGLMRHPGMCGGLVA